MALLLISILSDELKECLEHQGTCSGLDNDKHERNGWKKRKYKDGGGGGRRDSLLKFNVF